jgi:hypothetical protein
MLIEIGWPIIGSEIAQMDEVCYAFSPRPSRGQFNTCYPQLKDKGKVDLRHKGSSHAKRSSSRQAHGGGRVVLETELHRM